MGLGHYRASVLAYRSRTTSVLPQHAHEAMQSTYVLS